MILEIDKNIALYYFVIVGFLSWLLLAGFLISPSTYASLRQSPVLDDSGYVAESVMHAVRNVPLIYIASFSCLIAACGLGFLWWRWRHNYIWVNRYIVIPTLMNSIMGFGTTLLNIYTSIIGTWMMASAALSVFYGCTVFPRLRRETWVPV
ncbi:hypothetical protein B0I35DRAFT_455242 [Stachybotrys elegans]|uniref:Uncharacterized protein n=1 Tax=Stachybotrys elegans TaxID=80388 RepID=A0A8K0SCX1_9HYPO|nr:hypothetical protein B0I35DRAFT_455242 [Stachybotrys elegans]